MLYPMKNFVVRPCVLVLFGNCIGNGVTRINWRFILFSEIHITIYCIFKFKLNTLYFGNGCF